MEVRLISKFSNFKPKMHMFSLNIKNSNKIIEKAENKMILS